MNTDRLSPFGLRIKTAIFIIPFLFTFFVFKPANGQLSLDLQLTPELQNAQILRISDFNITGSGSVSQLFTLKIKNCSKVPISARLHFDLVSDRSPSTPIVTALSALTVPPACPPAPPYQVTYQDITRNGSVDYDAAAVKELNDSILRTGRLPTGIYTFTVTAEGSNVRASQQIVVSNPTTLDLISPGAPVGGSECFAQFGLLPQFKWDSNADRFLITVCEAVPNNASPEDVMQNQPRLQKMLCRGTLRGKDPQCQEFFDGSPSFIYSSGGLPLEFGKTYYWQVHAIIDAPSGELRLPSEIWCFQVSAIGDPGSEIMLQQLLSLLSSSELEALFREGGPLHGFKPTGAAALNGRQMNLTELITFLRNRSLRIVSTQVEP